MLKEATLWILQLQETLWWELVL